MFESTIIKRTAVGGLSGLVALAISCTGPTPTPVTANSPPSRRTPPASQKTSSAQKGTTQLPTRLDGGTDRIVYHRSNEFGDVFVTERDGIRCLKFGIDDGEQSCLDLGQPKRLVHEYVRMMMVTPLFGDARDTGLMVGLGGGVGVDALLKANPELTMDAVEINPLVVEVAASYFHVRPNNRLRVHVGDGRKFLQDSHRHWDMIFLDAFGADFIPFALTTREFIEEVAKHLNPKGIVVSNLWNRNPRMFAALVKVYVRVFKQAVLIEGDESANVILVASNLPKMNCKQASERMERLSLSPEMGVDARGILSRCHAVVPDMVSSAPDLSDAHRDVYDSLGKF